ncbi:MAG: helix-turn-helix transcriptional regulator [Firmicutes bacterium]|nr:helix-turn-helix transcriptional regulator [Bacillota bacterium]
MNVKQFRKIQGLSQKALAEKAGIAQATVHYIEAGGNATQRTLKKLATALGVKISDLLEDQAS